MNRTIFWAFASLSLVCPLAKGQDVVVEWNNAILQAIRDEGGNAAPTLATHALAWAHAAMFDAANSIDHTYTPYTGFYDAGGAASREIAVAQAAREVLSQIPWSNQNTFTKIEALYGDQLASYSSTQPAEEINRGIALGTTVGQALINHRIGDGSFATGTYSNPTTTNPGQWVPPSTTTSNGWGSVVTSGNFLTSEWGNVRPWSMPEGNGVWTNVTDAPGGVGTAIGSYFRPAAPPELTSAEYTAAYNEVKAVGESFSSTRTQLQSNIAKYWVDGPFTTSPPGHWNRIAQQLVVGNYNKGGEPGQGTSSIVETARVFAMLNIANADAAIAVWDSKRAYDFWRPTHATAEAGNDGNPDTTAQIGWTSFMPLPSFPSYVSGHSTFSMTSATILGSLFGETESQGISFIDTQDANTPLSLGAAGNQNSRLRLNDGEVGDFFAGDGSYSRQFSSLTEAAEEAGMSRIYGGIHYSFDNINGQILGQNIAAFVFANEFQLLTVPEPTTSLAAGLGLISLLSRRRRA